MTCEPRIGAHREFVPAFLRGELPLHVDWIGRQPDDAGPGGGEIFDVLREFMRFRGADLRERFGIEV